MRRTSAASFAKIEADGLLSDLRFKVYRALYRHGPMTANEVNCFHVKGHNQSSISPRFAELEKQGVIYAVLERACRVTGNTVIAWDVTEKLPMKLPKKVKKLTAKEENAECCGILETLGYAELAEVLRKRHVR
jgi:predicted transcriptional regulator